MIYKTRQNKIVIFCIFVMSNEYKIHNNIYFDVIIIINCCATCDCRWSTDDGCYHKGMNYEHKIYYCTTIIPPVERLVTFHQYYF